jgi:putative oxidoreductase
MTNNERKMNTSLLLVRLSIFLVMFMWTLDKFINPGHAAKVFEKFYFIPGLESFALYGIAAIEMIILGLFVTGIQKNTPMARYWYFMLFQPYRPLSNI